MRWYNFQRWGPWFSWKGTAERFGHCLPSLHHSNYQWHRRQRSIPKSVTMKDGQLCCSGPGSLSTANQTGSLEHLALAYVSHNRCSQGGATTPAHPGPMELGVACLLGSPGILNEIIFTRENFWQVNNAYSDLSILQIVLKCKEMDLFLQGKQILLLWMVMLKFSTKY